MALRIDRLRQIACGNRTNVTHDVMQRQQQHTAHRHPADDNHSQHHYHNRRQDPQNALVVAFIVFYAFTGKLRLLGAPFAINDLHGVLLLLGVLLEHPFQIAFGQEFVHLRKRRGVDAVLLFQTIDQTLVHARRFRQAIVFVVMALRFRQQFVSGINQLAKLTAVKLVRHVPLQTQHAAVKRDARLVEAYPGVGEFGHVLAGDLRDVKVVFVVIERRDENACRDKLHRAQNDQYGN